MSNWRKIADVPKILTSKRKDTPRGSVFVIPIIGFIMRPPEKRMT